MYCLQHDVVQFLYRTSTVFVGILKIISVMLVLTSIFHVARVLATEVRSRDDVTHCEIPEAQLIFARGKLRPHVVFIVFSLSSPIILLFFQYRLIITVSTSMCLTIVITDCCVN